MRVERKTEGPALAGVLARHRLINVRLMHGPADSQNDGWLAYGTLRTTGLSPLSPADEPFHGQ